MDLYIANGVRYPIRLALLEQGWKMDTEPVLVKGVASLK